jgi:hypothetical protein
MIAFGMISISLIGIVFLAYWIPKKLGYPKSGKYISEIAALSMSVMIILTIFEDNLFTKSDAQKLLTDQGIQIKYDFNIEENRSMYSPGDYYHTFTLNITANDKIRIINEIKRAANFNHNKPVDSYFDDRLDYYSGPKRIKNYETEDQFIRELFEPNGEGYAPTWRKIEINKKGNQLVFEDIDE